MLNKKDLSIIKKIIIEDGGITLNSDGKIAELKNGYMVSLDGYEKKLKSIKLVDLKQVKSYLKTAKKLNAYVGFWLDDNTIYLDISININNKKIALKTAKENKQLAIFNCKKKESIYL